MQVGEYFRLQLVVAGTVGGGAVWVKGQGGGLLTH